MKPIRKKHQYHTNKHLLINASKTKFETIVKTWSYLNLLTKDIPELSIVARIKVLAYH